MKLECKDCSFQYTHINQLPCASCNQHGMKKISIPPCSLCYKEGNSPMFEEYKNEVKEDTRVNALSLVTTERNRQDIKWGQQNHSQQAWVGILGEEFGEYCQAVNETYLSNATKKHEGGYDRIMEELTHVAAVAVNAMECLMRNRAEDNDNCLVAVCTYNSGLPREICTISTAETCKLRLEWKPNK